MKDKRDYKGNPKKVSKATIAPTKGLHLNIVILVCDRESLYLQLLDSCQYIVLGMLKKFLQHCTWLMKLDFQKKKKYTQIRGYYTQENKTNKQKKNQNSQKSKKEKTDKDLMQT